MNVHFMKTRTSVPKSGATCEESPRKWYHNWQRAPINFLDRGNVAGSGDVASIKDRQDGALRFRFTCSVNNEAVLKAPFKLKDDKNE